MPVRSITLAKSLCLWLFAWGKLTGVKLPFIFLAKMSPRKIVSIHPAGGSAEIVFSSHPYPHQEGSVLLSTLNILYSVGDSAGCSAVLDLASLSTRGALGTCVSWWWMPCCFGHLSLEAFIFGCQFVKTLPSCFSIHIFLHLFLAFSFFDVTFWPPVV